MKIHIKGSGSSLTLEVAPSDTIASVKTKISEGSNTDARNLVLALEGQNGNLDDTRTLEEVGVREDGVLDCLMPQPAMRPGGYMMRPGPMGPPAAVPGGAPMADTFRSASLYVGDLAPDVSEAELYAVFQPVAPVSSVRVCRHAITRQSLGYAYVNFHNQQDAERVLDTMNYATIKGRTCRIMWSQRDPSARRSGVGNIFIKNLAADIDSKDLHDTFSVFGDILSCKVVTDREGRSCGYGFVHFDTQKAADEAIAQLDNKVINGLQVRVSPFVRVSDRSRAEWTNVYVKNLPSSWDVNKLREMFGAYGDVKSVYLSTDDASGKSKGFGFVGYDSHDHAAAAVNALNGLKVEHVITVKKAGDAKDDESAPAETETKTITKELYVGRAQKKAERERDLKQKFEAAKQDRMHRFQGLNLYVRNLDESVTEDDLRRDFAAFGTITSVKIMRDTDGRSRLFGFVCFSTPDEAAKCVSSMNGNLLNGKPLFVALWQPKELRRAQLAAQFQQRQAPMFAGAGRGAPGMEYGGMVAPAYFGMSRAGYPMPVAPRGAPMQAGIPMGFPGAPAGRGYMPHPGARQAAPGGPGAAAGRGRGNFRGAAQAGAAGQRGDRKPRRGAPQQQGTMYRNGSRNVPEATAAPEAAQQMPNSLDPAQLAALPPATQKNVIGENLFALISKTQADRAGKITGMLLEGMDTTELLVLLESQDALATRINEALEVLRQHEGTA